MNPVSQADRRRPDGWSYKAVVAAATIPLIVIWVLFLADVPIGRPNFLVYRYSALSAWRLQHALIALVIGAAGLAALDRVLYGGNNGRAGWTTGALTAYVGLVVWVFLAPPQSTAQHSFNMLSPSHEGAFVLEGRTVPSIREYVARTFYQRLQQEPEKMRGRRVLSNPPGVTIAAVLAQRLVDSSTPVRSSLVRVFGLQELDDPAEEARFAAALLLAIVFMAAWAASLLPAYGLCRLWMPAPAAVVVAFACVFNPATVEFSPGKDPAQMFTVLALVHAWCAAYVRGHWAWGLLAGVVLAVSTMVGLIHVWIVLILGAATLYHAIVTGPGWLVWMRRCALPSAFGALAVVVIVQAALSWNLPLMLLRLGGRYGQIQPEIITSPFFWTLLGLPMFLLFVGPLLWIEWTALPRREHDSTASLGHCLIASVLGVMTYSYYFANNSETPRLWMPFVPFLLVGMALRRSSMRQERPNGRTLCILLLGLQLTVTVLHWSMMDVRESEWRLFTTGRMWD